ncbi:hypothetical protein [Gimesia maris]|uniref:phage major capsid protein n=1 Tax=Gimesia maris TaxID=122 RepID=UPI0032EFE78C
MATIITEEIDRGNRSIPLILATENPVRVYDIERMEVVDEVLSLDGMDIPSQVPMADSHRRDSVRNTFGSFRDFEVINGELRCRAYFASDQESVNVFNKYADGHLTDFSVGAQSLQRKYDKKTKTITRSVLIEGSAVLKGADVNAKALVAQRAYAEPEELRKEIMNEELKKMLVERGLDPEASDKQTLEFVERELDKDEPGIDTKTALDVVRSLKDSIKPEPRQASADDLKEIQRAFKERYNAVDELCRSHKVDDKTRLEYLNGDKDVNEIATDILNRNYKPSGVAVGPGQTVEHGSSERDKFYNAVEYSMVQRSLNGATVDEELQREIGEAPAGANDFRYMRIPEIARQFCERSGMDVTGLPPQEIIKRAIGQQSFVERSGSAFHTTGSFANVFLNSMHKKLRAAYNEAPSTFDRWVRTAEDATDFKNMDKIVFGEMSMPEEVAENGVYPELTTSDGKESYRVAKNGGIFSITLEMMVNDDLGAMNRRIQMMGTSMRRKMNRQAYEILLDNSALSDGIALFHGTSHGANLDGTALGEGALDVGFNVMATQTGLDSTTVLGLTPRFLIVPAALGATALRLVNGGFMPTSVGSSPLYGSGRPRNLEVIEDGQLDSLGSATNWWLAADNNTIDTVEISYLQGERTPSISREDGFETDTIKAKIRQTYGFKAIDYRGLYQGNT